MSSVVSTGTADWSDLCDALSCSNTTALELCHACLPSPALTGDLNSHALVTQLAHQVDLLASRLDRQQAHIDALESVLGDLAFKDFTGKVQSPTNLDLMVRDICLRGMEFNAVLLRTFLRILLFPLK